MSLSLVLLNYGIILFAVLRDFYMVMIYVLFTITSFFLESQCIMLV